MADRRFGKSPVELEGVHPRDAEYGRGAVRFKKADESWADGLNATGRA